MERGDRLRLRTDLCRLQDLPTWVGHDLHHMHIHDTKPNRRRYPHLIDSLWNVRLVDHNLHMANPVWTDRPRWSLLECDRRESFLARHPRISRALNSGRIVRA